MMSLLPKITMLFMFTYITCMKLKIIKNALAYLTRSRGTLRNLLQNLYDLEVQKYFSKILKLKKDKYLHCNQVDQFTKKSYLTFV